MALVIYTKIKELQIQEKEIYEFGNWLRSFANETTWEEDEEYGDSYDSDLEPPTNNLGEAMEYPWDDFSYIVIPDTNDEIKEAEEISESLGLYNRFDVQDLGRIFFVIK